MKKKSINKPLLYLGILFLPYVFAWFTLKKGYSNKLRGFAFGWLALFVVSLCSPFLVPQQKPITKQEPIVKQVRAPSNLNNCAYAEQIVRETDDMLTTILKFHDERASYQEIAQWRVKSFNSQFTELQAKFNLKPAAVTHPDNAIAVSMNSDYLNRLAFLLGDIFTAARSGDYSQAKEQTKYMKEAINLAKSCIKITPEEQKTTSITKSTIAVEAVNSNLKTNNRTQIVKKSKSGICHDQFSNFYERTKNYSAFESIQECISSGGRLPKR